MTAEHEGHAGLDALMAAITDEPLPDGAHADAAFLADHRSATADVALLREQLGIIGRALADPPPAPAPESQPVRVRASRARQRASRFAFGTLAVAAVASVVTGMGWLLAQNGASDASSAGGSADQAATDAGGTLFGSPTYLACAGIVAEGTVTAAEPLDDPELLLVTVHVTTYYKGGGERKGEKKEKDEVTYVVNTYEGRDFAQGDRVLFGVPRDGTTPDYWAVGEKEVAVDRALIKDSLTESRRRTCE
jgi:hypothetical protein